MQELKARGFNLVVVTSRQAILESRTRAWLDVHYPGIFLDARFGNHYGEGRRVSKRELCADIKATVLIDDQPKYAVDCSDTPYVLLFGDYGWNTGSSGLTSLPRNVVRVHDWAQARAWLSRLRLDGAAPAVAVQEITAGMGPEQWVLALTALLENQAQVQVRYGSDAAGVATKAVQLLVEQQLVETIPAALADGGMGLSLSRLPQLQAHTEAQAVARALSKGVAGYPPVTS